MKKISLATKNVVAYSELRIKILNYFPEGERVLHEHVLDGSFEDIDEASIVNDVLIGNNSTLSSVIQTLFDRKKSDIAVSYGPKSSFDHHSSIDAKIDENPYKDTIYCNIVIVFKDIAKNIERISEMAKDSTIPFDDIITDNKTLDEVFLSVINNIYNTNDYMKLSEVNMSEDDKERLYYMILHELKDGVKWTDRITDSIHTTYEYYLTILENLQYANPEVYPNRETAKELAVFLDGFDAEYRQFILSIVKALFARYKELNYILDNLENVTFKTMGADHLKTESDDDKFAFIAFDSYMEQTELDTRQIFNDLTRAYYSERVYFETGMRLVFEDGLATSAGASNDGKTNNQQQSGGTNQTANKTTSSSGDKTKQKLESLINMIKNFFEKTTKSLQDIINKQSGNLEWLKANREALINRNFNGITFNVLPYEKYVNNQQILNDIDTFQRNYEALIRDKNITKYNSQKAVNSYLFSFMSNGMGSVDKIGENVLKYYKVKNAPMEVMPYKGAQAKALMPIMVDYCISFYSSFYNDLTKKFNDLNSKVDSIIKGIEVTNESVMYEDEQVQGNQENKSTNNTTSKANNTTPSVKVDNNSNTGNTSSSDNSSSKPNNYQVALWASKSLQEYVAYVCTAVRDRNFDYLKIIKAVAPKGTKEDNSNTTTDNTNNTNTEQNNEQQTNT